MFLSQDAGATWFIADDPGLDAAKDDGAFAASNSSLTAQGPFLEFVTGGGVTPHVYNTAGKCDPAKPNVACPVAWTKVDLPMAAGTPASGAFSVAGRMESNAAGKSHLIFVTVGGIHDNRTLLPPTVPFPSTTVSTGRLLNPRLTATAAR